MDRIPGVGFIFLSFAHDLHPSGYLTNVFVILPHQLGHGSNNFWLCLVFFSLPIFEEAPLS